MEVIRLFCLQISSNKFFKLFSPQEAYKNLKEIDCMYAIENGC